MTTAPATRTARVPAVARAATAVLLAVFALLGTTPPASAHNTLTGSEPAEGAEVDVAPERVTLTFDQPVQSGDVNQLVVTGPSGDQWARGPVAVDGNEVSRVLGPLGPAGEYTIGFRILSADGHPVTQELSFTLTTEGTGTPAETATAQPDDAEPSANGEQPAADGVPVWVWIGGAVALLAAGVALALRLGREQ